MKKRHPVLLVFLLITVPVLSFGAGAYYQAYRQVGFFVSPRQALERSSDVLVAAIRALRASNTEYVPTKIPPDRLDQSLVALHDVQKEESSTALYNFGVYNKYSDIWSERREHATAPVVLEIGPGSNLAQGVIFSMTGAKKYYGLDLYTDPEFYNRYSYEAVSSLLSTVAPHLITNKADAVFRIVGDKVTFDPEKLEYLYPHQSYDIPLPAGSVDYVFSHSVLEHVTDLHPTAAGIFRVLPNGGLTAHHIDMRDHRDFSTPLEFLKVDAETWRRRLNSSVTAAAGYNTNRLRLPDFIAAFEKSGFRILKTEVTRKIHVTEETRRLLQSDFQNYSLKDLSVVSAMIIAEKP